MDGGEAAVGERVRRSADEAKRVILQAAERRFREGGQAAVRVQLVARDVGLTDAAVHHHFGSRKGLLRALLRHAGRGLREQLEAAALGWSEGSRDLASLTELISECYEKRGYAQLAMWLMLSGMTGRGSGMLSSLVDVFQRDAEHAARDLGIAAPTRTETQFVVALFHMVQVAEPLFGEAMRRSVGLPSDAASRDEFRAWLLGVFQSLLQPMALHGGAHVRKCAGSHNQRPQRLSRQRTPARTQTAVANKPP
jgi:AcrR family transcriptional regulator